MSLVFGGVEMDADHVLGDDTDVTEMSQMISSLIQSGLSKEQAIDIFKDIGDVVVESLKNKNYLVYNGDYSAVHEMLENDVLQKAAGHVPVQRPGVGGELHAGDGPPRR